MGLGFCPGYWSGPRPVSDVPVLIRDGESWMSITPLEIESQEIGIRAARGNVLIFGLGLGWAAAATSSLPAVERVTVVERDPDVIALHDALGTFAQLPSEARAKLRIERGDAFTFAPPDPVDLLMPDIWLPLVGGDRVAEVRRMQARACASRIYFWGQELEIARHAAAARRPLDAEGIARTVADWNLPLLLPQDPDYPAKIEAAAARWMRGRWLPETPAPA